MIEDQLRSLFPDNLDQMDELKERIINDLEEQFGSQLETLDLSNEPQQYRDSPNNTETPPQKAENKESFYLVPLVGGSQKNPLKIRLWKETYYWAASTVTSYEAMIVTGRFLSETTFSLQPKPRT